MDGGGARGRVSRSRRGRGPNRRQPRHCAAGSSTRSPGPSRARRSRRPRRPPAGRARRPPTPTGSSCCRTCRPAGFVVAITATGFAPQRFEAVTLRVGQVLDLDATLTVAGVREDVVVDAASGRAGRHRAIRRRRRDHRRPPSTGCRSTAATSWSWRCWCPATRRRRTSIRPRPTPSSSRRPGSSAAAATSRSTAWTTTTTWWAGRCSTSSRRACRSSRSPPAGLPPTLDARPARPSTSSPGRAATRCTAARRCSSETTPCRPRRSRPTAAWIRRRLIASRSPGRSAGR